MAQMRPLKDLFGHFHLEKVKLGPRFANVQLRFEEADKDAAWELYVEMLTRIATQPLPAAHGHEQTALESVYSLFATTRDVLHRHGRRTVEFSKVAIPVLNQVVRPFTAKWHQEGLADAFRKKTKREEFRRDLVSLQSDLRNYNQMLASIAGVEDLTDLEQQEDRS